jgi:hypothetical protein
VDSAQAHNGEVVVAEAGSVTILVALGGLILVALRGSTAAIQRPRRYAR